MTTSRLPDFIVIGAMKCATSSLHDQLAQQAGIFMSTPKEPNFFSNDEEYERGIGWYHSLFDEADADDLCGESSTHYAKLPTYPHTIDRMRQHVPNAKLIYVMRDPVDRLLSHYVHEWSERTIEVPIDEAIERYPRLVEYSCYSMQLRPFLETYGTSMILPVFFKRMHQCPQMELERICRFVGYDRPVKWNEEQGAVNASAQRLRSSRWRDMIVEAPGLKQIRRGLVPKSFRDWVKSFWVMKDKPKLSESSLMKIRSIFDEDLSRLGEWLGMAVTCDNFNSVTAERSYGWTPAAEQLRQVQV